ncbi:MAG: DNA cytosine methyltransferase [Rhodobacteraceae bacterium]|nr:DNA cytosine methyltransferase [Paracoccaceae bacterium]
MHFIDLFVGCGGLSLGLSKAGWHGLFAIEKSPDAFKTFKQNLIDKEVVTPFAWPEWLPCKPMTTSYLIKNHKDKLKKLRGSVDLIAGGPPCQGFSFAGRRNSNDPRNTLVGEYMQIVELVQPRFLLLENVRGFTTAFKQNGIDKEKVYAEVVKELLEKLDYIVFHQMCNASMFGVPQPRPRYIMIAYKKDICTKKSPFIELDKLLPNYRHQKGLHKTRETSVKEAISDLEINGSKLVPSEDTKNFNQIQYKKRKLTSYQKLMRQDCKNNHIPNSLRLARHKDETLRKFNIILMKYPKGKSLTKDELLTLGTKKQCFTPLHPDLTSRTITTLPDDLLHYSEPRILTVRENARIQSFPDWFDFLGNYTTGGIRRKEDCPRYSQVGNAVPPLMAEALGTVIKKLLD